MHKALFTIYVVWDEKYHNSGIQAPHSITRRFIAFYPQQSLLNFSVHNAPL